MARPLGLVSALSAVAPGTWLGLLLSGSGFGLFLGQSALSPTLRRFADDNAVDHDARLGMLGFAVLGGLLACGVAAGWALRERAPDIVAARLTRALHLLAPLGLCALLPGLFSRPAWKGRELWLFIAVLGFALLLERLLRVAFLALPGFDRPGALSPASWAKPARFVAPAVLALLVGYYCIYIGQLTVVSHHKLATNSSDLAEFDNLFFNALRGYLFRLLAIEGELRDWSALKVHAEFGLYALLPFYALKPGPETLLRIQAALVGLSAVPLYLLARRRIGDVGALVAAFAFLQMPAVQRPNFYDFHFTPLGMFFVAWHFVCLDAYAARPGSRWARGLVLGSFVLALLSREDVSLGLAVLGLFLVLQGRLRHEGVLMLASSVVYFVVVKFWLMPRFGTMWFDNIYEDLKAPRGEGFTAIILTLLTNPVFTLRALLTEPKLLYALHMIVPWLALWLRRPLFWLAVLPGFVSTLLVTNRSPMFQSSFQYTYLWVPYVGAASVLMLGTLAQQSRARLAAALVGLTFCAAALGVHGGILFGQDRILGGFGDKTFKMTQAERQRLAQLRAVVALIPPDASVAATEAEGPHVSTRLVMYSLKFTLGEDPDYLLLGHVNAGSERDHLLAALDSGSYGLVAERGPFLLAKRGADGARNNVLRERATRR